MCRERLEAYRKLSDRKEWQLDANKFLVVDSSSRIVNSYCDPTRYERPLRIVCEQYRNENTITYGLKEIVERSWGESLKDFQPARHVGMVHLLSFLFKLLFMHIAQLIIWVLVFYVHSRSMNVLGYSLCLWISVKEIMYFCLIFYVLWHYPACIAFNMSTAETKVKLLYVLSPEKYFLIVIGHNDHELSIRARCGWLVFTYVFDFVALVVLLFGRPPLPLAIMVFLMCSGGIALDIIGGGFAFADWGGTRVSTACAG